MKWTVIMLLGTLLATQGATAFDCNTDCRSVAGFRYPCPTLRNPRRTCEGREPGIYATCVAAKEVSCSLWDEIYDSVSGTVTAQLKPYFNASTWAAATAGGEADEAEYMAKCELAGVAICLALGAEFGGGWGAALGGAAGTFISYRLCEQSRHW